MTLAAVLTVDVEAAHGDRPWEQMIEGRTPQGTVGVDRLMDIFEEHRFRGTFFVDVYEVRMHGEARLRELVERIAGRGHAVELHTHPAWWTADPRDAPAVQAWKARTAMYDPRRYRMHQYGADEQRAIVARGVELLERWLGRPPAVHRAGGYGANADTLRALAAAGIGIDCSRFHPHPDCHLEGPPNRAIRSHGVLSLPVTTFRRTRRVRAGGRTVRAWSAVTKTDLNWTRAGELEWALRRFGEDGLPWFDLFMHSYSLVRYDRSFSRFTHAGDKEAQLRSALGALADAGVAVATVAEQARTVVPEADAHPGDEPERVCDESLLRYAAAGTARRLRRLVKGGRG